MDDHVVGVYVREIRTQCSFAINAARALNNVLPRISEAHRAGDAKLAATLHEEVFRTVHSLLTHASNVSRMLWPARPKAKKDEDAANYDMRCASLPRISRADRLRDALGLPATGHALESRRLRDHLEHFDERLDHWHATSERKNIVQDMIGPKGSVVGLDETDFMRWFDPTVMAFRFRGEEFEIQALVSGVEDVRQRAVQYEADMSPESSLAAGWSPPSPSA